MSKNPTAGSGPSLQGLLDQSFPMGAFHNNPLQIRCGCAQVMTSSGLRAAGWNLSGQRPQAVQPWAAFSFYPNTHDHFCVCPDMKTALGRPPALQNVPSSASCSPFPCFPDLLVHSKVWVSCSDGLTWAPCSRLAIWTFSWAVPCFWADGHWDFPFHSSLPKDRGIHSQF